MVTAVTDCYPEKTKLTRSCYKSQVWKNRWKKPQLNSEKNIQVCGLWVINCGTRHKRQFRVINYMLFEINGVVNVALDIQSISGFKKAHKQMYSQSNCCLLVFSNEFSNNEYSF